MSKFGQGSQTALRSMAEVPMVEPEEVRVMRELRQLGWGYRSIAREVGVGVMTVKRYLRGGAKAGEQTRPQARRLDEKARVAAAELLDGAGQGMRSSSPSSSVCRASRRACGPCSAQSRSTGRLDE